jgi:hypothetical protein
LLVAWLAIGARDRAGAQPAESVPAVGIRGVTVGPIESSQQPGVGYGTEASAAVLDELVRLGANWVSITPFGRLWDLDSTEIVRDFEAPYDENRRAVGRMVAQAKARGLRVLLVPHLWVETGGWRGEIELSTPARWDAYQASYRAFVLAWASDAARWGADAFSIGVECKSWSGRFGGYWTSLIRAIRGVFPGAVTYSANWDEAEDVLFWDQLDWIGINAFYPLSHEKGASTATYAARARDIADDLERQSRALGMPVVFLEVGYTSRLDAAVEPWLWPDTMQAVAVDEAEPARALAVLVGAMASRPWFRGFYLWRYYANLDDVSQEAAWGFSPHGKLVSATLSQVFALRWAADPRPPPWRPRVLAPGNWSGLVPPFAGR